MLVNSGLPYSLHTKLSHAENGILSCVNVQPRDTIVALATGSVWQSFSGAFFPLPKKALVESLPVKAWSPGKALHSEGPAAFAIAVISKYVFLVFSFFVMRRRAGISLQK